MKRITVSLPDELVAVANEAVEAGHARNVSALVAEALRDYSRRESLDQVLAGWNAETPVPEDVRQRIDNELDTIGLTEQPKDSDRLAG